MNIKPNRTFSPSSGNITRSVSTGARLASGNRLPVRTRTKATTSSGVAYIGVCGVRWGLSTATRILLQPVMVANVKTVFASRAKNRFCRHGLMSNRYGAPASVSCVPQRCVGRLKPYTLSCRNTYYYYIIITVPPARTEYCLDRHVTIFEAIGVK